jgi:hypothetical protein
MTLRSAIVSLVLSVAAATGASAQSFEVGAHFASAKWSEFDDADTGFGGRVSWKPVPLIGVDAEVTWYPSDFEEPIAFSRSRVEGLFGATVGPRIQRARPFVKAAAGFLKVGQTPGAFACLAIFPPPLACTLASGSTLPAFEIGGGVEIDATQRLFIRADVADRILKYPGPTFDSDFELQDDGFFGGALRFTLGAGWRF